MANPQDIFEPKLYSRARRPFLEAETLPPWCYTSEAFYQREVERIFRPSWNFVGREDEIARPGDYFTIELAGESIILVRDRSNQPRAFANTCRHRGARLLAGGGNCKVITCPYHGWGYGLDGSLVGVPGMAETLNFDKADYGLVPLHLQSWAGFMFVSFETPRQGLLDYLGDLPRQFASYGFADMRCVRRKSYDLACNWKIYVENAMEDYHTPVVHKSSIGLQKTVPETTRGNWDAIYMECDRTIAILPDDITTFPHIASLQGKPAHGTYFTLIYPSTFFASTQDCMWWLQSLPLAAGRTRVVIGSCFPRSTVARPDFTEVVPRYYRRWDKSLPEDNDISEQQHAGLTSMFARPGRLSVHEPIVHAMANWVLDRVLDPNL
jgi:phenylpropionate dioxygenase-like ring-hydroxylating dioxygenase large terminal subunit